MKSTQVTLKDIAKKLGITVSTVSRALKGYPDISPDTKKAVTELAKQLHYRPNPIALSLRKNRSNIIGVLIPEIVHYFFSTVISGIIETADEAGYSVILCQTNESYEREVRDAGALLASRVDGLLISLANDTNHYAHLEEFLEYKVPIVLYDKICDALDTSKVLVDDFEGAFHAVEHLIVQGCKRIAYLHGPQTTHTSIERLRGYTEALKKYGLSIEDSLIYHCAKVTFEEGFEHAQKMMQMSQPPDAIFGITDLVAIGALSAVRKNGWRVPEDIAIVGFSDWQMCQVVEPTLTSVHQPGFEMGKIATQILLNEIELVHNDKITVPTTKVLKTHLIVRESSVRQKIS
jgi:LacI family transcriptional regulator